MLRIVNLRFNKMSWIKHFIVWGIRSEPWRGLGQIQIYCNKQIHLGQFRVRILLTFNIFLIGSHILYIIHMVHYVSLCLPVIGSSFIPKRLCLFLDVVLILLCCFQVRWLSLCSCRTYFCVRPKVFVCSRVLVVHNDFVFLY